MRILVIDQCSGSKDFPSASPVYSASEIDEHGREALLDRDGTAAIEAKDLYTGRQQQYVSEAVDTLRKSGADVDRYFVSAGFGVVDEDELLPPYEVTFNGMSASEIDARSERLGIPAAIQELIADSEPYDIVFFALGNKYYRALDLDAVLTSLPEETVAVLFNQEERAETASNVISISASTSDAEAHRTIAVALKGVYLKHFADHIAHGEAVDDVEDIQTYCTTEYGQSGLGDF